MRAHRSSVAMGLLRPQTPARTPPVRRARAPCARSPSCRGSRHPQVTCQVALVHRQFLRGEQPGAPALESSWPGRARSASPSGPSGLPPRDSLTSHQPLCVRGRRRHGRPPPRVCLAAPGERIGRARPWHRDCRPGPAGFGPRNVVLCGHAGFDAVGLKLETHPVCDDGLGPLEIIPPAQSISQ